MRCRSFLCFSTVGLKRSPGVLLAFAENDIIMSCPVNVNITPRSLCCSKLSIDGILYIYAKTAKFAALKMGEKDVKSKVAV